MNFHSIVIFVKDIEVSKAFYTKTLGFSIIHDFGNNIILNQGLSIWQVMQDHPIGEQLDPHKDGNRFELYFEHDDMDTLNEQLTKAGITFFQPLNEEAWGQRTLRFFDPDHHLIEVGEPLEIFVKNLAIRGLTNVQIHKKTGIPQNTVNKILK